MGRGNPENLRRAAADKSAATKKRAEQGIQQIVRDGQPVTFRGVAKAAGVSLDFLYSTGDVRRRIEHLRGQQQATTPPAPKAEQLDPDQPSSVVRTLTAELTDLKRRHREEVQQLRQALEAAHGENLELRRRLGHRRNDEPGALQGKENST